MHKCFELTNTATGQFYFGTASDRMDSQQAARRLFILAESHPEKVSLKFRELHQRYPNMRDWQVTTHFQHNDKITVAAYKSRVLARMLGDPETRIKCLNATRIISSYVHSEFGEVNESNRFADIAQQLLAGRF